ncbi:hypothetical protein BN1723_016275 [Verticillium longisporum]|uniref:Uncharacterized protein n=1 Tax=Verticillium longisporum TaxID=100787 RepID=A0A0G4NBB0_VERLO|nr:hypothetical protein BN1723_016275 [Verticillium longisporum]
MPPTASRAVQGRTVQATCLGLCFQARLRRTKHLIHTNGEKVQPSLARGLYDGTSSTAPERNLTGTTRDTPRKIPRRCNRIQQRPGKQPAFKLSTGSIMAWPRHCICMRYYQHAIETWLTPSRQGPTKASSSEVAAAAGVSARKLRPMCMRRHHVSSPSLSSFVVVVVVVVLVVKTGSLLRASMQPSTVLPPMALSLSYNVWALDWPSSGAQSLSMLTSFGLDSCLGPSDTQLDRLFVQGTCSSPASSALSTLLVDVPASVPPSGALITALEPSPLSTLLQLQLLECAVAVADRLQGHRNCRFLCFIVITNVNS